MKVCVITCTGGRPELFALCRRWVQRQSVQPNAWIVTNDVDNTVPQLPGYATHIRIQKSGDGCAAAANALHVAIQSIPKDHDVVVMEDDDWYGYLYIEEMVEHLQDHPIVQLANQPQCNVPASRWKTSPMGDASSRDIVPAIIGFRGDQSATVLAALRDQAWPRTPHLVNSSQFVAIKGAGFGLPGRRGATQKHDTNYKKTLRWKADPGHRRFRDYLGDDAESYIRLLEHS